MPKRKAEATQQEIDDTANNADDAAVDISEIADRVSLMGELQVLEAASSFNRLAEACQKMNRMLLAKAMLEQEKLDLVAKLEARQAASPSP